MSAVQCSGLFLGGEDTCTLDPLQLHTLTSCGFNSSNPLIIITHGWSVDGMMESWILRLAKALKSSRVDTNVVITDWLTSGSPTLSQSSDEHPHRWKGHSPPPPNTSGLDPAGPLFEGISATDRLSPDDAEFVDAIHTFTRERLGFSVGIKQAVAHYDFYPNGGDFQPGCDLRNLYDHISEHGLLGFEQTVKCAHERSVHLFIDSLLNKDKQSMAYRCTDNNAFVKGICLDCRKNRCNTLGYDIKKVRTGRSKKLYLQTGSRMPFKLFHYQFRIQFVNQMEMVDPSITISLTGTKEESGDLTIPINDKVSGNTTFTFLITLDKDLGDLMLLKFYWESSAVWRNMWNQLQTIFTWGKQVEKPQLTLGKISVKAGETQHRTSFCAMENDGQHVEESQEKVFVRCKENTTKTQKRL
ncbi:Hepatic triacylglycerol lipase [Oryzias melastigma]|uniref:Hepatic triacylglycerol lipase n=1 Tax=Oryzias melastigma TaxID=30732 RepID=A0A834F5T1_ORYME|nr:Hepatic triacylglycerol lipase [Oryzias melastigma]